MVPRWVVERKYQNNNIDRELLVVIEIYAEGENKELVKKENRKWTHERKLLLVEQ